MNLIYDESTVNYNPAKHTGVIILLQESQVKMGILVNHQRDHFILNIHRMINRQLTHNGGKYAHSRKIMQYAQHLDRKGNNDELEARRLLHYPGDDKFQYVYNQKNKTGGGIQKVATKRGKFKDYMNEIQNSIELGFPSFAMHETSKGSFAVPLHVYNGKVYATDERIVDISNDGIDTDKSQLVYFKEGASIYGLMGPQGSA